MFYILLSIHVVVILVLYLIGRKDYEQVATIFYSMLGSAVFGFSFLISHGNDNKFIKDLEELKDKVIDIQYYEESDPNACREIRKLKEDVNKANKERFILVKDNRTFLWDLYINDDIELTEKINFEVPERCLR